MKDASSTPKPVSLCELFTTYSLINPRNEAVIRLERNPAMILKIQHVLAAMGQTKFVNLVHIPEQARIAIVMYSGDGIVTKITPENYMSMYKKLPRVVLPFEAVHVRCDEKVGDFIIENFPYLRTEGISQSDVDIMRGMHETLGVKFREKDDKPDNLGRLPDGTLAVVDGDAVFPKESYRYETLSPQCEAWEKELARLYPRLYSPEFSHIQSDHTDFTVRPRYPLPPVGAKDSVSPSKSSHWSLRLFRARGNDGKNMPPRP